MKVNRVYNNDEYAVSNEDWHVSDSAWKAIQIRSILDRNKISFQRMSEIGCGAGEILRQLSLAYPEQEFSGYEVSEHAYKLSLERESERVKFYFEDLTKEEIQFDCLLCIDVFEHVEDYIGFLKLIRNKADYKIFHIPLDINVVNVLRASPIQHARDSVGHLHYFTRETALETLKYCGYEIVDEFYTTAFQDFPAKTWKGWMMKLPRWIFYRLSKHLSVRILGGCALIVLAR